MNHCTLPLTHPARAYVPSHQQTTERLAETFRQYYPIRVSPVHRVGDDYDAVQRDEFLRKGEYK